MLSRFLLWSYVRRSNGVHDKWCWTKKAMEIRKGFIDVINEQNDRVDNNNVSETDF